jgi:hypothetical protein
MAYLRNCLDSSTSLAVLLIAPFVVGCSQHEPIVVNSVEDIETPPEGTVTLRSALASAASGQPIVFDPSLDGATIELSIVGEDHTTLKGEVMGIREEPSGPVSYLVGTKGPSSVRWVILASIAANTRGGPRSEERQQINTARCRVDSDGEALALALWRVIRVV